MAIVVIGATCSLGELVVDKLLAMDIDVVAKEESHLKRNQDLLKYSNSSLESKGEGFSISFDGSNADIIIGTDIIVQDLLPTKVDRWIAPEFQSWIDGDGDDFPSRYWLSVIDAANAIAHIVQAEQRVTGIFMCGRREWECDDSRAEFEMLWKRTEQGISGEFTKDTLFGHQIAGMVPKPMDTGLSKRPNLDPLHNLLLDITGDGWRPMIPFRTGLMTLIAGMLS
ncbi:MAG: hypothetical protein VX366_07650 [Candidatus Thermoplasmatota archaeon]|nr:hypothetical protein [Euryarchaeota archaeon]MEE2986071.1 hypothetical protein [Candidatus Thermoplasmatota archaeon]|tara:strand:- start:4152 stop:4826 length:675 start_codon:yes stop_codon:yes gene_type:complete